MRDNAYVTKVIDGDSFETRSDRMRLEGLDAPEMNSENGQKTKGKLEELILEKNIEYKGQARDDYGRLIVQVWVDGVNVNEEMKSFIDRL